MDISRSTNRARVSYPAGDKMNILCKIGIHDWRCSIHNATLDFVLWVNGVELPESVRYIAPIYKCNRCVKIKVGNFDVPKE